MGNINNNYHLSKSNYRKEESTENGFFGSFYKWTCETCSWIVSGKEISKSEDSVYTRFFKQIAVIRDTEFVQGVIENEKAGIDEILKALDLLANGETKVKEEKECDSFKRLLEKRLDEEDRVKASCDNLFKDACERGLEDGNNGWYRKNIDKCPGLSERFFDKYFEELVSLSSEERAIRFKEMGLSSDNIKKAESIFQYEGIDAWRFFKYIGLEESEAQHWEMNWLQKLGKFAWDNKGKIILGYVFTQIQPVETVLTKGWHSDGNQFKRNTGNGIDERGLVKLEQREIQKDVCVSLNSFEQKFRWEKPVEGNHLSIASKEEMEWFLEVNDLPKDFLEAGWYPKDNAKRTQLIQAAFEAAQHEGNWDYLNYFVKQPLYTHEVKSYIFYQTRLGIPRELESFLAQNVVETWCEKMGWSKEYLIFGYASIERAIRDKDLPRLKVLLEKEDVSIAHKEKAKNILRDTFYSKDARMLKMVLATGWVREGCKISELMKDLYEYKPEFKEVYVVILELMKKEDSLSQEELKRFHNLFLHGKDVDLIEMLIDAGLDVTITGSDGNNAIFEESLLWRINDFEVFTEKEQKRYISLLLKSGASVVNKIGNESRILSNIVTLYEKAPWLLELVLKYEDKKLLDNAFGMIHYQSISSFSNDACLSLFIFCEKNGFKPWEWNSYDVNALMDELARSNMRVDVVRYLIDKGSKFPIDLFRLVSKAGLISPEFTKLKSNYDAVIKYPKKLIITVGDVGSKTNEELKAIVFHAILDNKKDVFMAALAKLGDINFQDKKKLTPLHTAILMGRVEYVELLLDKGARTDIKDVDGRMPLVYGTSLSQGMDLKLFKRLAGGIDLLTYKDSLGNTFLHYCSSSSNPDNTEILEYLVKEIGLDIDQSNSMYVTPFANIVANIGVERFLKLGIASSNKIGEFVLQMAGGKFSSEFRNKDNRGKTYIGLVTEGGYWSEHIFGVAGALQFKFPDVAFRIINKAMLSEKFASQFNGLVFQGGQDSFEVASRVGTKEFGLNDLDELKVSDFEKSYQAYYKMATKHRIPTFGMCAGNQQNVLIHGGKLTKVSGYTDEGHYGNFIPGTVNHFFTLDPYEQEMALEQCELKNIVMPISTAHHYTAVVGKEGEGIESGVLSEEGVSQGVSNGLENISLQHHQENYYLLQKKEVVLRERNTFDNFVKVCQQHNRYLNYANMNGLEPSYVFKELDNSHKKIITRLKECAKDAKSLKHDQLMPKIFKGMVKPPLYLGTEVTACQVGNKSPFKTFDWERYDEESFRKLDARFIQFEKMPFVKGLNGTCALI